MIRAFLGTVKARANTADVTLWSSR